MSAEIFILSGARAGERIVLDTTEFRVGSATNCEVFFDPKQDLAAKGKAALFRLRDDGWSVSSTGIGELLLNQTVVSGRARIRSGDVLRMSNDGPAFSFSILTAAAAAASPMRTLDPRPASRTSPSPTVPAGAPTSARPVPARSTAAATLDSSPAPAQSAQAAVQAAHQPSSSSTGKMRPILWAGAIGGGLAIIVLVVCITAYVMTPQQQPRGVYKGPIPYPSIRPPTSPHEQRKGSP